MKKLSGSKKLCWGRNWGTWEKENTQVQLLWRTAVMLQEMLLHSLCCIFTSWTVLVLVVHGEKGQGLEKWSPISTTLNSLPFRALQWASKLAGLLFWCPFSQSHQILSPNCICSFKIFLAVLFCISPPGTKKFCKPAVKMKRVFTFYHAKRKVLILLCCFENHKREKLRGLKNNKMATKMQTIVIWSRS